MCVFGQLSQYVYDLVCNIDALIGARWQSLDQSSLSRQPVHVWANRDCRGRIGQIGATPRHRVVTRGRDSGMWTVTVRKPPQMPPQWYAVDDGSRRSCQISGQVQRADEGSQRRSDTSHSQSRVLKDAVVACVIIIYPRFSAVPRLLEGSRLLNRS